MSTLASLTVALGMDADQVQRGATRAVSAIRSIGATTAGMTQDAEGNWRSLDGRVLSSAHATMTNAQRMRDALGGVGQVMRSVGQTAATGMANGIKRGGQVGVKAVGGLTKALGIMSVGAIGATSILAAVPLAVLGLGIKAAAEAQEVQDAFSGLKDHISSTMKDLAKPLVQPLVKAADQMRKTFDQIAPDIGKLFEAAAPMIQPLVAGVGELVKGLISGFLPVMKDAQPLVEALGDGLGTIGDALGGFLKGLSSGLGGAAGVFDGLFGVIGTLLPTLGELMGLILKVAGPILTKLLVGLQPVITQLGDALKPVIVALGPVLDALVDAILALLQACLPLLPVFAQLIVALLPALTPILKALVPLFVALGEVVNALIPILVPIIAVIGKLAAILGAGLALLINTVVIPAVQAVAALLRGDFSKAMELAKKAVSGAWNYVVALFTKLPGRVWQAISPLAGKLGSAASAAGARLSSATKAGTDKAVNWVKSLPGRAKGALSGLGSALFSAGSSLISGFINGIKSKLGSVKSTLQGLTSKLTSWKGPAPVDRKILTPAGRMVISGFQRGIAAQAPLLRRQLQGLTSDLPGMAMNVNPSGVSRAAARQDQRMVIDVTGSDEDMKRLIRRIVKNDGRGSAQRAFGT